MQRLKQVYGETAAFYRQEFGSMVFTTGWAFAGIVVLSFAASLLFPQQADGIVAQFASLLQQSGISDKGGSIQFSALLVNNLTAMILAVGYGLLPFLRLPALTLGVNGAALGLFAGYYMHQNIPLWKFLVGILPHGIFEITALLLSAALGLYLCRVMTDALMKRQKGSVGAAVNRCGQILLCWVVPLVILAAIIETYVTPVLFQAVL